MRDGYYTPTIDEFHVGFEFESNYILFNQYDKEWVRCTIDDDNYSWFFDSYKNDAVDTEFRVKRLTASDVEDEGFKLNLELAKYARYVFNKPVIDHISKNESTLSVLLCPNDWVLIWITEGNGTFAMSLPEEHISVLGGTLFAGYIKNKSELKRVLKMIGYESPMRH